MKSLMRAAYVAAGFMAFLAIDASNGHHWPLAGAAFVAFTALYGIGFMSEKRH